MEQKQKQKNVADMCHDCIDMIDSMLETSDHTFEELQRQDWRLTSTQSKLDNIYDEQQKAETYLDKIKSWFGYFIPQRIYSSLGGSKQIEKIDEQYDKMTDKLESEQLDPQNCYIDSNRIYPPYEDEDDVEKCLNQMMIGMNHLKNNANKISVQLDKDKKILDVVTVSVDKVNNKQDKINKRF